MKKQIYVGPCGQVVAWKKLPELFSAIEINTTFYKFPTDKQIVNWQKALAQGRQGRTFKVSIKAFQGLTHTLRSPTWKRAGLSPNLLSRLKDKVGCLRLNETTLSFWQQTEALAQTLGAEYILFQLPKHCQKEEDLIEGFFSQVKPKALRLALEIRWPGEDLLTRIWLKHKVIPVFDPFLEPALWQRFAPLLPRLYLRLHGQKDARGRLVYQHQYTEEELDLLQEKLMSARAQEILVFFNNVYMKQDALRFIQRLLDSHKSSPRRFQS